MRPARSLSRRNESMTVDIVHSEVEVRPLESHRDSFVHAEDGQETDDERTIDSH